MKVFTRVCIQDWAVTAKNGDHFEVSRGEIYTTADDDEGKCMVFSNFWVRVPLSVFAGKLG